MFTAIKRQTRLVFAIEIIAVLVVLSYLTGVVLAHTRRVQLTNPAGQALLQVTVDLAPNKPVSQSIQTSTCSPHEPCPSLATYTYPDKTKLSYYEQLLLQHGWVANVNPLNSIGAADPTSSDTNVPFYKKVNGLSVCLTIDNALFESQGISIMANLVDCQGQTGSDSPLVGWQIYYPTMVPARFTDLHLRTSSDASLGMVQLSFSTGTPQSELSLDEPYLELDESKSDTSYNPPTNCALLISSGSSAESCSLYLTTAGGHKVYISDDYNTDTIYLYFKINDTVFTLRKWYDGDNKAVMSDLEMSQLIDSLAPISLPALEQRIPPSR